MNSFSSSAVVDVVVIVGSFSLFFASSRMTFLVLSKVTRVSEDIATDEESQRPRDGHVSTDGRNALSSSRSRVKKERHLARISDLPNQLVMSVGGVVTVTLAFVMTSVLSHPLSSSSSGHSPLTHYSFLVIVGNHLYCVSSDWFFATARDNRVTSSVTHCIAAATFVTAAFTQEMTMLALTGVIYRVPFTLFDFEAVCTRQSVKMFLQRLSIVGVVVFLVVLPSLSVGFSLTREAIPRSLSLGSVFVFFLSVIYFALFAVWVLVVKVKRLRRYSAFASSAVSETSALLRNSETNVLARR